MQGVVLRLSYAAGTIGIALLSIGAGFAATRTHYDLWKSGWLVGAYPLFALAALLFLLAIPAVRGLRPLRAIWPLDAGLAAIFEYEYAYLTIGVRNDGVTLRDAGINVLIPASFAFIDRAGADGKLGSFRSTNGSQNSTSEQVLPGEESLYWQEKGLHVLGGGNTTRFHFRIGSHLVDPGDYPVRLKLYDDEVLPRALEVDGTVTIPPRELDVDARRAQLARFKEELVWNRVLLRRAVAHGSYGLGLSAQERFKTVEPALVVARLNHATVDGQSRLSRALIDAFTAIDRIAKLADPPLSQEAALPIPTHSEAVAALADVLDALVQIELAEP